MQPNSGGSKKRVCATFFKGGSCAYGDKCKNEHTRDPGGSIPRSSSKRPAPKPKQPSGSGKAPTPAPAPTATPAPARTPAPAPARTPAPAPARAPSQAPSKFTPSVASRSPTPPDRDDDIPSRLVPTGRVSPPLSVMSRDVCAFYEMGECGAGDECDFLHSKPASNPRPTATRQAQEPKSDRPAAPPEVVPSASTWDPLCASTWGPSSASSNQPSQSDSSHTEPGEVAPGASSKRPSKPNSRHSAPREGVHNVPSRDPIPSPNQPSQSNSSQSAPREGAPSSRDLMPSSNRSLKSSSSRKETSSPVRKDIVTQPVHRPASPFGSQGVPASSREPEPEPRTETPTPVRKDTVTQPVYRPASPFGYQGVQATKSRLREPEPEPRTETSSLVRKDTVDRPASLFGYQGVPVSSRVTKSRITKSRLREPTPEPEPEPESELESEPEPEPDASDDDETDDGQFDDPDDDSAEDTRRISHPASSFKHLYEETSRGCSPTSTSAGSHARIYPEVAGPPKAMPYVTDIIAHWSQFADPQADGNIPFCKLLAQNQCTQGEACRFRHVLTIDEYVLLFKEQQPILWTVSRSSGAQGMPPLPPATLGTPPQPMPAEVAPTRSMGRSKRVSLQKIECSFYPSERCRDDDKCLDAHVGTPLTNNSLSQGRSSSSVPPASDGSCNTSRSNGSSKIFCRNLELYGSCKDGDSCHYSHERADDDQIEQSNGGDGSGRGIDDHNTSSEGEYQKDDADGTVKENDNSFGATGNSWAEVEVPEAVDNDDSSSEKPNTHPDPWEGIDGGELPEDQKQDHQEFAAENTEGEAPAEETEEKVEDGHETAQEEDQAPSTTQVDVEEPEVEQSETKAEDIPDVEKFMYHCAVRFNGHCDLERVTTAVDSRKVLLSNLPPDTNVDEIRDRVQGIGEVQDVAMLGEAEDFATMSVEFKEHADAMAAVKQLNDQQFGSRPIFAQLDSRAPVFARSPLLSQMLMVTWPGATVSAWVFYETVTLAKQAATKLNKTKFQGREIGAEYERRKEKRGPYPIRLTGMPLGASKADLEALCKDPAPTVINIRQPSYANSLEDDVRRDLEKFGRIEQFRISSEQDPAFRTVAYVTMQSFSVADEGSKALNNTEPAYLGGEAPLGVKHIYHTAYKVLPKVFQCIVDRLNVLREKYKGKCEIIDSSDGYIHTIEIRASIDESTIFSEANEGLGDLVDGLLLVYDGGRQVWDPYLETSSSAKAIDRLNDQSSGVPYFVHCDQRLRCVRVHGSLDGQQQGKTAVMKILKMVKEQCYEIILQRPKISPLIENGLKTLRNSIGANKVTLDIVRGRLIVRGTAEDFDKANLAVSVLASSTPPETTGTRSTLCPLCERVPVSPVKLTCRHAYCKACLQFALSSTAQRDCTFFRCIFGGRGDGTRVCGAPLPYTVVRDHLTSAEEVEYMKAVFMVHVRNSNGLFFFCPTPDCTAVYRSGEEGIIIRCAMCAADLCPRCCSRVHDGSLCDESRISMITG